MKEYVIGMVHSCIKNYQHVLLFFCRWISVLPRPLASCPITKAFTFPFRFLKLFNNQDGWTTKEISSAIYSTPLYIHSTHGFPVNHRKFIFLIFFGKLQMSEREEHNGHVRLTDPRKYDQCVFKDNNWKTKLCLLCIFARSTCLLLILSVSGFLNLHKLKLGDN